MAIHTVAVYRHTFNDGSVEYRAPQISTIDQAKSNYSVFAKTVGSNVGDWEYTEHFAIRIEPTGDENEAKQRALAIAKTIPHPFATDYSTQLAKFIEGPKVNAEAEAAKAENETLKKRIAELEAKLSPTKDEKTTTKKS